MLIIHREERLIMTKEKKTIMWLNIVLWCSVLILVISALILCGTTIREYTAGKDYKYTLEFGTKYKTEVILNFSEDNYVTATYIRNSEMQEVTGRYRIINKCVYAESGEEKGSWEQVGTITPFYLNASVGMEYPIKLTCYYARAVAISMIVLMSVFFSATIISMSFIIALQIRYKKSREETNVLPN